ncbi:hypothetical protein G436_4171 [Leptospira interrogans serovar Hardjo str. Norma]|uniref:Uncharacterized protein n=1 Tax=Leptospira interrogans serovar Hardjo str. Norma TaxID=1279460 RepID=A0A0M4MXD6_LEPIR|nr:hypothetical protein G436_4171 [Leptospira interrogans serovar Hardjo str. Norma]
MLIVVMEFFNNSNSFNLSILLLSEINFWNVKLALVEI